MSKLARFILGAATTLAACGVLLPQAAWATAVDVPNCTTGALGASAAGDGCWVVAGDGLDVPGGGTLVIGPSGNDSEAAVEAAWFTGTGSGIFLDIAPIAAGGDAEAKIEEPGLSDGDFTITNVDGLMGDWNWAGPEALALLTVKSDSGFAVFDVRGTTSGTWAVAAGLENANGQPFNMSHVQLWQARRVVPEPSALLLAALGLGVAGLSLRLRQRA